MSRSLGLRQRIGTGQLDKDGKIVNSGDLYGLEASVGLYGTKGGGAAVSASITVEIIAITLTSHPIPTERNRSFPFTDLCPTTHTQDGV